MPNIGPGELIVILLIALLIFGPRKLPELGKSLGAGIREFRKGTQGLKEELEGSFRETTPPGPAPVQTLPTQTIVAQAVVPPITPAQGAEPVVPQAVTPQSVTPTPTTDSTPRS